MDFRFLRNHRLAAGLLALAFFVNLLLAGCDVQSLSGLLPFVSATPPAPTGTPAPEPTQAVTPSPQPTEGPVELILWVPPRFDPTTGTDTAMLLQERLDEFANQNPDVILRVRVKAESGPGNVLDAMAAAQSAASDAAPSLVALSRADLETAAIKGLVQSLGEAGQVLENSDWYPYARQMVSIQDNVFGYPFGGDALVLVYRPERTGITPSDWESVISLGRTVIFPAGELDNTASLVLYQSAGGIVENAQRRPVLQAGPLADVLLMYTEGASSGTFPTWLTDISSQDQAWETYEAQNGSFLIAWSSRYLADLPPDSSAVPLPPIGQQQFALSRGWAWAVSETEPRAREASVRLAEFLTEDEFLAEWTEVNGFLPTRPSALDGWENQSLRTLVEPVALSAQVYPSVNLITSILPALNQAMVDVIENQADPVEAAETASESLNAQ